MITSRCTACGATSLDGVLTHADSCVAAKPKIFQGNIMPAIEVTGLDITKLKNGAGSEGQK